jgi:hypothetical protein
MTSTAKVAPNLTHKAFELVTFIDKLPLQIECLACYDNYLILGLTTGRILIYEAKIDPTPPLKLEANFEKAITVTKKPIQQIEICKEFDLLLTLFDSQLHVFDLVKFQLQYSLPKTKNCSLFALSLSTDRKLLRLCVACKKKLQFYYLASSTASGNSKFMELTADLELNDTPRTLEFTRENLIVFSLRKEFFYYKLPSSSSNSSQSSSSSVLKQPEAKFSNGSRLMEPLCEKLYNDSFLIGLDENKTILYDPEGKPSLTYALTWTNTPSTVTGVGFYLVGLLPTLNCVEVVTIEPKSRSIQLIEMAGGGVGKDSTTSSHHHLSLATSLPPASSLLTSKLVENVSMLGLSNLNAVAANSNLNSPDRLRFLKSNGNAICYVATQCNVWCLVPSKINDQIEQALRCKNYDLGLNLIECHVKFNSTFLGSKKTPTMSLNEEDSTRPNLLKPFFSLNWLVADVDSSLERALKNMHALDLFIVKKKFKQSLDLFQTMNTDPTHLIAFLPGLLPASFRERLNFDHLYPDLNAKEQEEAIDALIDYLNYKRKEFIKQTKLAAPLEPLLENRSVISTREHLLEIIDTTLLKCYLKSKENLVHIFIRLHPNFFHIKESETLLLQHNKLSELCTLYERKELHKKALELLASESSKSSSSLFGLKPMVDYLKRLTNKNLPLMFTYGKYVLEKDLEAGMGVFFAGDYNKIDEVIIKKAAEFDESLSSLKNAIGKSTGGQKPRSNRVVTFDMSEIDDESVKELDREKVIKFFQESIEPSELSFYLIRLYLQYCVFLWNETNSTLNNLLLDIYKRFIESDSLARACTSYNKGLLALGDVKTYRRLLKLLLTETNGYDLSFALSRLDLDAYPEERAIVLGKMGKHHEALNIYVNKLNDTDKAEAYCHYVYNNYSQPTTDVAAESSSRQVYYQLLEIYLQSDYEEIRLDGSIRLLNAHSNEIGTSRTLELLPAQLMKCKNLSPFFETMLYRLVRAKHDTQIRQRLMIALQLQVHETKIMCQNQTFTVNDEQMCRECNKRMGKSAMVRYPNGVLIHYGCLKRATATTTSSKNT